MLKQPVMLLLIGVVAGGLGWASWRTFGGKSAPPAAPVEQMDEPQVLYVEDSDLSPIRRVRQYAATIDRVIGMRAQLLRFREGVVDTLVEGRAEQRAARDYIALVERWNELLAGIVRDSVGRYRPESRYAVPLERSANMIAAARASLQAAVAHDRVLPRAERQQRLDAARGYLANARTNLSELPR